MKTGEIKTTTSWVLLVRFDGPRPWIVKKLKRSASAESTLRKLAAKLGIRLLAAGDQR